MRIAMVASEANPYVKTGGLADVVYALSKEMVNTGETVSVFIPLYTIPSLYILYLNSLIHFC